MLHHIIFMSYLYQLYVIFVSFPVLIIFIIFMQLDKQEAGTPYFIVFTLKNI